MIVEAIWHDGRRFMARVDPIYGVAVILRGTDGKEVPAPEPSLDFENIFGGETDDGC